ncbi:hypothetical protein DICVIV_07322 [Dictyocaulus viviparus]|uniref:C2H2-type domain-containing protein n=1 Tax=Dictyocaulus viviparus TaxID=29172 RepID=A0A0D8XS83_DICVI|nr:hypothetical protein DICVIV_07322 [Dictyocaulus viviparus]
MGRRKQAKPTKRSSDYFDETFEITEQPSAKILKNDVTFSSICQFFSEFLHSNRVHCKNASDKSCGRSCEKFDKRDFDLSAVQPLRTPPAAFANGLGALFQFVGKMQDESTWNGQQQKDTEVDSILKCLQCSRTFQTMEMLVRHMQETQHFNNLPKTYSFCRVFLSLEFTDEIFLEDLGGEDRSLIQMDRQKVLNMKLQIKSDGMKLACIKCGEIPTSIDKHLKEVHEVKTSADWLKNIRVVNEEGK